MKVCPTCGAEYDDEAVMCGLDGQPLRSTVDPLVGQTVGGRYRLISRLGAGGMSSVYLARHVLIDRLVAVKVLRRDLAKDSTQRDRFVREARAVNRINHENIVEITDFGETADGVVYLVMEYVPGTQLLRALESGPMDVDRAVRLCRQIAAALGRAHEMGVVHRDLKPENVLLVAKKNGREAVKLLDFGIAKLMDAPSLTGSQQIFGTPGYIAPEYIQSTNIDGRADLYSLGVMLYEMVTGAIPFDYEYPGDLLVKHVTEPPIRPSVRHPGVQAPLEEFILRCLAKKPEQRFRDAYHFLDEIERMHERLGGADSWGALSEPPVVPDLRAEHDAAIESLVNHTIPAPPPEMDAPDSIPPPPSPLAPEGRQGTRLGLGPAGVRRWRQRFDALDVLARDDQGNITDKAAADRLEQARQTLVNLEQCVAETADSQRELEALTQDARDFRATLGRGIDRLARTLSGARRREAELSIRREELREKRRELKGSNGDADALLWEQAAIEQQLRDELGEVALGEAQLRELQDELARRNEDTEARTARAVLASERGLIRADRLADALRGPLDEVERTIRERWE